MKSRKLRNSGNERVLFEECARAVIFPVS